MIYCENWGNSFEFGEYAKFEIAFYVFYLKDRYTVLLRGVCALVIFYQCWQSSFYITKTYDKENLYVVQQFVF